MKIPGTLAQYIGDDNQLYVDVAGVPHLAANVVWTMHYGKPPNTTLIFRNGDPHDLRIDNLAEMGSVH